MAWRDEVTERQRFCIEAEAGLFSFSELCRRYGVARKTGYKWLNRYRRDGPGALENWSHRPHTCPHRTPPDIEWLIVKLRRRRPRWGAPKIRRELSVKHDGIPSVTTVHNILRRHGLIPKRRKRPLRPHPGRPLSSMDAPNAVWTADFKGQFKTQDGRYCYPLTVQDGFSRYLLAVSGLDAPKLQPTKAVFQRLFRTYGLPDRIRTDNGTPFASNALGRLSQLSVWWVTLGITPELIEPGQPQQNGRHERMHRTLKAETARPPSTSLHAQRQRFYRFRDDYNQVRPHQALGQNPPASRYSVSDRVCPAIAPEPTYPDHFERRLVSGNGGIRWNRAWVNVSSTLIGHTIGLEETADREWTVYFGPLTLGWLDEEQNVIVDRRGRSSRCRRLLPINL